jgi:hypothetical protein
MTCKRRPPTPRSPTLALHLALHGTVVLTVSIVGGLLLYRTILKRTDESQWHLLHAGGTARGIMLIALAGIVRLPALSLGQLTTFVVVYGLYAVGTAAVVPACALLVYGLLNALQGGRPWRIGVLGTVRRLLVTD